LHARTKPTDMVDGRLRAMVNSTDPARHVGFEHMRAVQTRRKVSCTRSSALEEFSYGKNYRIREPPSGHRDPPWPAVPFLKLSPALHVLSASSSVRIAGDNHTVGPFLHTQVSVEDNRCRFTSVSHPMNMGLRCAP